MELCATIDGSSHTDDLFFLFYLLHLSFMNDCKGLVPVFTRVLSSISCL